MTTIVLLLGDAPRWLRIEDGAVAARGEGLSPEMPGEARVVAVVPAREVAVHQANLPDLSGPQARGAARLLAAEQSAGASDGLHVAVGPEGASGDRTIVAIEAAHIARHLAELAALGLDPDAMLAAPLLLPRPEEDWLRGDLGEEVVVRGRDAAFADDSVLTPMVTAGAPVVDLDHDALEAAVVAAAENPEVDLRQPPFAKLRRWSIDWPLVRRLAVLGLLLAATTFAVEIVTIAKLNATADRIEAANAIKARAALPPGATLGPDPAAQLDARLAALGGAGGGFLPLAAAVSSAINDTANADLAALSYDGVTGVRATVRGGSAAEVTAVAARIRAQGLSVAEGAPGTDPAHPSRELTVTVN